MELSYFVVDQTNQFRRVSRDSIEAFWKKRCKVDELECEIGDEFRLLTVLSDENLLPVVSYFVRLKLEQGAITDHSKIEAFDAMTSRKPGENELPAAQCPAAQWQFNGWPKDWQHQMAVALDVPAEGIRKIGLGGPLLMSELWGIPLERVIEYFEEANEE